MKKGDKIRVLNNLSADIKRLYKPFIGEIATCTKYIHDDAINNRVFCEFDNPGIQQLWDMLKGEYGANGAYFHDNEVEIIEEGEAND